MINCGKLRDEMRRGQGPMDALTEQLASVKGTTASLERTITNRQKPIEAKWTPSGRPS